MRDSRQPTMASYGHAFSRSFFRENACPVHLAPVFLGLLIACWPSFAPASPSGHSIDDRPLEEEGERDTAVPASALLASPAETNWGTVYRGEQLDFVFKLKNTDPREITLGEIKIGCGCTTFDRSKLPASLAPGETAQLPVHIDTGNLLGKVDKWIDIESDASGATRRIWMRGEVLALWHTEPAQPLAEAICGGPKPAPFRVELRPAEPLQADGETSGARKEEHARRIEWIEAAPTRGIVTLKSHQRDDGVVELDLTPQLTKARKPALETETLAVRVRVDGRVRNLQLPFNVMFRPRVHVQPRSSVYFKRADTAKLTAETPVVTRLQVTSRGLPAHRFKISKVSLSGTFFTARLIPGGVDGRSYILEVSVPRRPIDPKKRFVRDIIVLETDDLLVPRLRIPVRAQF